MSEQFAVKDSRSGLRKKEYAMRIQEYYSHIITKSRGRRGGPTFAEAQRDYTSAVKSQSTHLPAGF